ncbi:hypothetical protein SG1496 [Sodalis glossinidius str. 'morsitans']|uniref:Uncharacterized protein n=2 Tax=Sodalis glossinidius (strain morsitans) TaxID=343509 RepID=Q2NSV4_SODGM|nr:hypothetical protein SG1496 [Sodalis glossinidius str. 'morsitans']
MPGALDCTAPQYRRQASVCRYAAFLPGHSPLRGRLDRWECGDVSLGRSAMDKRLPTLIDLLVARKVRFFFTPDGILVVRGHLDLRGSGIAQLPERLVVAGSLLLTGCPLRQLPGMLSVGEVLDLKDTSVTALPSGLTVGGPLFLENTPLRELAAHSRFEDSLDLESTPVSTLPVGLKVNGYLNIRGTAIAHLPPDLQLSGPLLLDAHRIRSPLAWRRVTLPSWQPAEGEDWGAVEEDVQLVIFAVRLAGEIKISAGGFYGSPAALVRSGIGAPLLPAAQDCLRELAGREEALSS